MDDPIFDPWPIVEEPDAPPLPPPKSISELSPSVPVEPPASRSRWRSSTADVPVRRPIPRPEVRGSDAEPAEGPTTRTETAPAAESTKASVPRAPEPAAGAARRTASPVVDRLRALAIPRLEDFATRLEASRHRTLLDDRLDRESPTLRFRLMPWLGPFDATTAVEGSVLELTVDGAQNPEVVARFWLDPLATAAAEELRIAAESLGDTWLDHVLTTFVAKALRMA